MYSNSLQNNRNLNSMLFVTRTLLLCIFTYVGHMPHFKNFRVGYSCLPFLLGSATHVTKLI